MKIGEHSVPAQSSPLMRRQEAIALYSIVGVIITTIVCQVGLLVPGLGSFRFPFRVAAFAASLAALMMLRGGARWHPSAIWLAAAFALMTLQFFNPTTNSALAGIASICLSLAIAAPIIWASGLRVTPRLLERCIIVIWAFQTLSASFGVLQALNPGRFSPEVAETYRGSNGEAMKIVMADGESVFRPMGLTDTPGGAASAGLMAYLLGLGLLTNSKSVAYRAAAVGGMAAGLFCMVMCQVRVTVVLAVIMTASYCGLLFVQARMRDLFWVVALVPVITIFGAGYALSVGGDATASRLQTLVEKNPNEVYYSNRGHFLEDTFGRLMEDYPFGAGLGRHGMINVYFGDASSADAFALWAEIQWTVWLYDGGAPLMAAYFGAILVACYATARITYTSKSRPVAGWAGVLTANNIGLCALTFSYAPFVGQAGLEFWLLNATVYAAAATARSDARRPGVAA